jgi:adenosylcobinamide-GDP ribazoletransferase
MPGKDAPSLAQALPWFPLVGLLIGGVQFGVAYLFGPGWPQGTALAVLAAGVLLTRGLHLDGLSDFVDGFWGSRDRTRTLEIMKDPRMGAFGGIALVLVILTKWACYTRLVESRLTFWVIPACVLSRWVMVWLAATLPYARAQGGTAAPFVREARPLHLAVAFVLTLLLMIGMRAPLAVPMLGLSVALAIAFTAWFRRRLGGVTGDLLGASNELVEVAILLGAVLLGL